MSELRQALAAAIADRQAKREQLEVANVAACRGAELVASLEHELETLRNRGVTATIIRSSELVAWAQQQEQPLPRGIEARFVNSQTEHRCATELNAALAANSDLLAAVYKAEQALRRAESAATAAAAAILGQEAETLSEALVTARRLCWRIETQLQGLAHVHLPAASPGASPMPIRLPDCVNAALNLLPAQLRGDLVSPVPHAAQLYTEGFERLLADPAAAVYEHRNPDPAKIPAHLLPRTVFVPQDRVESERLEQQKRELEAARAATPTPAHVASVLAVADQHMAALKERERAARSGA
jgi:hypothetical protein